MALQAATGNIGAVGGSSGSEFWGRLPDIGFGSLPVPDLSGLPAVPVCCWPVALLQGRAGGYPSDIHLTYSIGSSCLNQGSDIRKNMRAFQKVGLVVTHDLFLTPTARFSDVVLPATTFLEREDVMTPSDHYSSIRARRSTPCPAAATITTSSAIWPSASASARPIQKASPAGSGSIICWPNPGSRTWSDSGKQAFWPATTNCGSAWGGLSRRLRITRSRAQPAGSRSAARPSRGPASIQTPFGTQGLVAQALRLPLESVRVITPYLGGGFGGKGVSPQAVEAARLSKLAGKPVMLAWGREEEFFYDTFSPAAVVKIRSGIEDTGRMVFWDYKVYFAGRRGCENFYEIPHHREAVYGEWMMGPGIHPFLV